MEPTEEELPDPFINNSLILPLQNIAHLRHLFSNVGLIVVMVYADWCFPCKKQKPRFARLADVFKDHIIKNRVVFTIDNIENPETVHRKAVQMVPGFFVYDSTSPKKGIGNKMEIDEVFDYLSRRLGSS